MIINFSARGSTMISDFSPLACDDTARRSPARLLAAVARRGPPEGRRRGDGRLGERVAVTEL